VARAALWRLQSQRYFGARVEPQLSAGEGRLDVRLHVTRGAQGSGVDIAFEGNTALADQELAAGLPSPGSPAFFEMLDVRSSRISSEVRMAYAGIGHLQAKVDGHRRQAASGRLRVTITVSEGALDRPGHRASRRRAIRGPRLGLAVGQPFDIAAYSAIAKRSRRGTGGRASSTRRCARLSSPRRAASACASWSIPARSPAWANRIARARPETIERSLTLAKATREAGRVAESRERLWARPFRSWR
jgi:hypothetical protein